ncbi:MAG: hypothetical protein GF364_01970 [Candidatus Lokiarchaeota archaeon]|nr:hypothetical protein [Candidatus Lokiarchaeota archaeon]
MKENSGDKKKINSNKLPPFLDVKSNAVIVEIYVKPNSKRDTIKILEYEVIVQTRKSPSKGKANKSVIKIMSDFLQINSSYIEIVRGLRNRNKIVSIYYNNEEEKQEILNRFGGN